jgi:hypothetical protein
MFFVIRNRVNRRILLWAGVLFVIGAVPCWVGSLGHAFAYSAWLGLDPKKFPIEAAHKSAQRWMMAAFVVQTVGVLLVGQSFRGIRPLWPIYIGLVPASFLPTLLFVVVLAHRF